MRAHLVKVVLFSSGVALIGWLVVRIGVSVIARMLAGVGSLVGAIFLGEPCPWNFRSVDRSRGADRADGKLVSRTPERWSKRARATGFGVAVAIFACAAVLPVIGLLTEGLLRRTLLGVAVRLLSALALVWLIVSIVLVFLIALTGNRPRSAETADDCSAAPRAASLGLRTGEPVEPT